MGIIKKQAVQKGKFIGCPSCWHKRRQEKQQGWDGFTRILSQRHIGDNRQNVAHFLPRVWQLQWYVAQQSRYERQLLVEFMELGHERLQTELQ